MVSERIARAFAAAKQEHRATLVTYIMGADPSIEACEELMLTLPEAGADIIELGLPFSDPMADGPTIQRAGQRALKAGGNIPTILKMVHNFRRKWSNTPIILMGYYNPIYHYGIEAFTKDATIAGVDGCIIVDLPPEEELEFTQAAAPAGLDLVRLTSPTTDAGRAPLIMRNAGGFVYYISVAGVTGVKSASEEEIASAVKHLRNYTTLPIAVGFGIKTPEQAKKVAQHADGVVVGSAIVQIIEHSQDVPTKELVGAVSEYVKSLAANLGNLEE